MENTSLKEKGRNVCNHSTWGKGQRRYEDSQNSDQAKCWQDAPIAFMVRNIFLLQVRSTLVGCLQCYGNCVGVEDAVIKKTNSQPLRKSQFGDQYLLHNVVAALVKR